MKTIHTYVILVDQWRRPSRQRNTQGRYLCGAKSGKEAERLVREAVKFGSAKLYYRATDDAGDMPAGNRHDHKMAYKQIARVLPDGTLAPARAATDPA